MAQLQNMRNQLHGIHRQSFSQLLQGEPAEIQIDPLMIQLVIPVKGSGERNPVFGQTHLVIETDLVTGLLAPGEEDFSDGQQLAYLDTGVELLLKFPFQGIRGGLQTGHMAADDRVVVVFGTLQKYFVIPDQYASDPVGKDEIICSE